MSELEAEKPAGETADLPPAPTTSLAAIPVACRARSPWRSLLWFSVLLGVGHFLVAPLVAMRMVVLVQFQLTSKSPIYFLIEVAGAVCLIGIFVHATLASLCLTWTVGKLWQRLLVYLLTLLIGSTVWFAGYLASAPLAASLLDAKYATVSAAVLDWDEETVEICVMVAGALPTVLLGLQLPFWIARVTGWRLIGRAGAPHAPSREALSIGDLMLTTAVVGASFGLLQVARPYLDKNAEDPLVLLAVALGSGAACAVVVTIIAWPLSWAFLKPLQWLMAWLVAFGIAASLLVLLSLLFLFLMSGINLQVTMGIATMIFSYVGGVSTGLALLRIDGWQLAPRGNSLAK